MSLGTLTLAPGAPWRIAQCTTLTTKPHTPGGVQENDATAAAVAWFYGEPSGSGADGAAPAPVVAHAVGQWPLAPLRATQRPALTTYPPGYNAAGAGVNDNDLTAGDVATFYGVPLAPVGVSSAVDAYSAAVLADNPLCAYRLDESVGTLAYDYSGNGRHGTYGGSGAVTRGVTGLLLGSPDAGVKFNNNGPAVWLPPVGLPSGNAPWTLEGLFAPAASDLDGSFHCLVGMGVNMQLSKAGIYTHNGRAGFSPHGMDLFPGPLLVANQVYHVAITWDGATVTIYLNGLPIGSETGFVLSLPINGGASIGSSPPPGGGDTCSGSGHMIAIYGTPLSAARITAHYAAGFPGLVVYPPAQPGTPHGQGMSAPWRTTQRVAVSGLLDGLSYATETAAIGAEQFYGDGTQAAVMAHVYGASVMAPLRATQRPALTTEAPGYNAAGAGAGVAENDLTRADVDRFYGVPRSLAPPPGVAIAGTAFGTGAGTTLTYTNAIQGTAAGTSGGTVLTLELQLRTVGTGAATSLAYTNAIQGTAPGTGAGTTLTYQNAVQGTASGTGAATALTYQNAIQGTASGTGAATSLTYQNIIQGTTSGASGPTALALTNAVQGTAQGAGVALLTYTHAMQGTTLGTAILTALAISIAAQAPVKGHVVVADRAVGVATVGDAGQMAVAVGDRQG